MRPKLPIMALVVVSLSLAGSVRVAPAQSLADIARKEEERRKTVKQPSRVLTEEDLGAVPPISPPPDTLFAPASDNAPTADGGTEQIGSGDASENQGTTSDTPADTSGQDEAYWSGRVKALQGEIERNQTFATALQSRINALTTDYVNQSDPVQQAKLEADRKTALADLDRVNKQVEDGRKALAALQEEARQAGVPAGWVR